MKVQRTSPPQDANAPQVNAEVLQNLQKANWELEERILRQTEELQRAQEQFQLVSRATNDSFWDWDLITNQICWNEAFQAKFGYTSQEIAQGIELWYRCLHPEDQDRVINGIHSVIDQGEHYWSAEYRMRCADGTYAYILDRGYVVYDTQAKPLRMLGSLMDMTDKRKAEQAVQDSERMFRTIANASPAALWMTDAKGRTTFVNQTWIGWTGRSLEENLGTGWTFSILEQDRARAIHTYLKNAKEYQAYSIDFRLKHQDGNIHWCVAEGVPHYTANGQFAGYAGSCVDITERKMAEKALSDSEQFYKALFQNASDVINTLDSQGRITYQSSNTQVLTGYAPSERIGKSAFDLVLSEDQEAAKAFFLQIFNSPGECMRHEVRLCHRDGSVRWIEILATNLLHEPVVGAVVLNSRDITERKLAEDKLRQQNEELLKINAELDRFVYRASHDLRAPLVSLLGLINIAKAEANEEARNRYFQLMEKSIGKLDTFIKGIIDHSRNARMEVSGQIIHFDALIEEIWDELKYIQGSDGIHKELIINGEKAFWSDLFRLKIIFSNILSNAIRYSNPQVDSFILIRVHLTERKAVIELEDNGFGIAEESLDKIFDMFYRASEKNVGSGLGLYIVREAVQALHGTISVRSQLGRGTTFRVEFPSLASVFTQ